MARTKLSELDARLNKKRLQLQKDRSSPYVKITTLTGRVLLQANVDDLFDADGNRFEDDLP